MSILKIRAALETAVNSITPTLSTAWENVPFTPVQGVPYQSVYIMLAEPDNAEYGADYVERGYIHINLMYPQLTGTFDINTRAQLIRSTLKRGNTYTSGGVNVIIQRTPEIGQGFNDGDRFGLPVKIRFFSHINEV